MIDITEIVLNFHKLLYVIDNRKMEDLEVLLSVKYVILKKNLQLLNKH